MRFAAAAVIALACAFPALCAAQWMWVDKDGRKVLSDQAPPPDIPAKNILRQPGVRAAPPAPADAASGPAALAPAPVAKPALATASSGAGKDKSLEDRKKAAEAAEAERRRATQAEFDRQRADNCQRAKQAKASLDSGTRVARTNSKGEREVLDDAARQVEGKRIEEIVRRDCAAAS